MFSKYEVLNKRELLQDALNLYWLRPENGLALAAYCLFGTGLTPVKGAVAADYACGDGINTFFKAGGRFGLDFDIFYGGCLNVASEKIVESNVDVFDYDSQSYRPVITRKPDNIFTYGTDHKPNLLKKAAKLDFYENLIMADIRENTPIGDETLDAVYCNSLYWVCEIKLAIEMIKKKLRPGGIAVFDIFTDRKYELDFKRMYPGADPRWQRLLNRGRIDNNPGLFPEDRWDNLLNENQFRIKEKNEILPAGITRFWNFGLRPLFPVLNRMVQYIDKVEISAVKQDWIAIWTDLLLPLLEQPALFTDDRNRYRLQYVVEKV